MSWFDNGLMAYDCETTSADPLTARIVTACAVECGVGGMGTLCEWLSNPGVDIEPVAIAMHGITNEKAQADGKDPLLVVTDILSTLTHAWDKGMPVVVMNAPFDMTIIRQEVRRLGLSDFELGPILDPLVLDRAVEPYRRGPRKLDSLAQLYGCKQEDAHTSKGDALTAARIVWKIAERHPTLIKMPLDTMQNWQAMKHSSWARNYHRHLQSKGDMKTDVNPGWPVMS